MRIDKRLNLVVPILGEPKVTKDERGEDVESDNVVAYVHSTPISREVFESFHMVLAKTFSRLYTEGLNWRIGPRVAAMTLKSVAVAEGSWEGPDGVEAGLVNEIKRLTNVAVPGASGWTTIPYTEATTKGIISPEDAGEVENAIAFFIVASAIHHRSEVKPIVTQAAKLWGGLITLSNSTEFAASLPTSIAGGNSGARAAA